MWATDYAWIEYSKGGTHLMRDKVEEFLKQQTNDKVPAEVKEEAPLKWKLREWGTEFTTNAE